MTISPVHVIGAGLAGCEAVTQLTRHGIPVILHEMRPVKSDEAHKTAYFAELVCSNSLRAGNIENAVGLLKEEMRRLGSLIMQKADKHQVPAGGALAVDRDGFAAAVTEAVKANPLVTVIHEEVTDLESLEGTVIVASGPLTSDALFADIKKLLQADYLHFFDAAAPIVTADSLDYDKVYRASRYDKGGADYLNCPFYTKEEYVAFWEALCNAESAPVKDFEHDVFEACMPIEEMAVRGEDTMRFGPLRPVGLVNPNTGHRPWANVQLRAENKERTLYNIVGFQTNLKWGEQKRVFSMIPGLENAEFVRYGVMHRNTFLDAPRVLSAQLCLKEHSNVFFAGQITGFEGYMESAACGLLAARNLYARLKGRQLPPPPADTMCGALVQYLTTENKNFQPMGANMGILPPLPAETRPRDKRLRYMAQAERAVASFQHWLEETAL